MGDGKLNVLYVGLIGGALEAEYSREGSSWNTTIPIAEGYSPRDALKGLAERLVKYEIPYSADVETPTQSFQHVFLIPLEREYLKRCMNNLKEDGV